MTKEGIREFKKFMELNGAWGEFVREFYRPNSYVWRKAIHVEIHHSLGGYLDKINSINVISKCFHWRDSIRGYDYWVKLSTVWRQTLITKYFK